MIYFITGNKNKFDEVQLVLPVRIEQIEIELPEIQEIDSRKIIESKLQAAFTHHDGPFIVEDTSLHLGALNGLPGPLIKWFEKTIRNEGLVDIAEKAENTSAQARTLIGYALNKDNIEFFEGIIEGDIVKSRGENGFGWDAIFQPKGENRTFAEMSIEEKGTVSMRRSAAVKLAQALA
ncbi:MAG: hypothetical protein JWL88_440 [Parcubacteria group bacterium]|nr:hypothetical protein [Parcubacteria group bacterium]